MTLALGFISGLVYVGSEASVVLLYWGGIGLLGGLTAGYLAGGAVSSGAVHGGLATVFGSLILLAIVTVTSLLFGGLVASFGVLVLGLLMLVFYAIPGALGGAIGSWAKHRRATPEPTGARA
ncbi:hypothetical protein C495_00160 [Natronorubrum sulfidifaciens JCM 14089]|uniref:DUF5518 domain-containing protein n=2 Tax=Natronorubrum sulfidifaciens TaxID=388259 RepID=L9WJD6_9EURY|nr:hypothetical protein C495_00160 [Natronorubrum sulfidifaciens JCM 14089]